MGVGRGHAPFDGFCPPPWNLVGVFGLSPHSKTFSLLNFMLLLNKMKPCKSHPHTTLTHPERPHHVLGSLLSAMAMSPTKKHVKNVHGRGAMEPTATILQGLLSSLVIQFTFLFIIEDLICLSNFLELHVCVCVCVCVCA